MCSCLFKEVLHFFAAMSLTLIIGLTAGCGTGAEFCAIQSDVRAYTTPTEMDLPAPSELKLPSGYVSSVFFTGNQFQPLSYPLQHVTKTFGETRATYAPGSGIGSDKWAYATYLFSTSGYDHEGLLKTSWAAAGDFEDCWIGMPDFNQNTWLWYAVPASGEVQFDDAVCIAGDVTYAIVLITGNEEWELSTISLGSDAPPRIIGVNPLFGNVDEERVFEATFDTVPQGEITWSWDFGAGAVPDTSTEEHPSVVLASEGIYECTATATNAAGAFEYTFPLSVCPQDSTWQIEAVRAATSTRKISLAVDDQSHLPRIAYIDPLLLDLAYAFYDGVAWHHEQIDYDNDNFEFSSRALRIDSAGTPHVAFIESPYLVHAWRADDSWHYENVDNAREGLRYYNYHSPSLAIGIDDHLMIAFHGSGQYDSVNRCFIGFASHSGDTWSTEDVFLKSDAVSSLARISQIDAGPTGLPSIAYLYTDSPEAVCYAELASNWETWDTGAVGDGEDVEAVDMALSPVDGTPHVCYMQEDASNVGHLKHGVFAGTEWFVTDITNTGDVGPYVSIAVSSTGKPYICYYERDDDDLRYVHRDFAIWLVTTVDALGEVGGNCCMVLDSSDRPHFAYFDYTEDYVKYARLRFGIGET